MSTGFLQRMSRTHTADGTRLGVRRHPPGEGSRLAEGVTRRGNSVSRPLAQAEYLWGMFRRVLIAAVVFLALVLNATAVLPAAAKTNKAAGTHKLIVAVRKNMPTAADKKLAVLVLISQNGALPRSRGHAEQAAPFCNKPGHLPCKDRDQHLLHGQLRRDLSSFRLGQSQARSRPQLSAQGLGLRLHQGKIVKIY